MKKDSTMRSLPLLASLALLAATLAAAGDSQEAQTQPASPTPHSHHHGEHGGEHGSQPQEPGRATMTHSFADVEHWVKVFDDPARNAWQKPEELVKALHLHPGQRVADIGAGTGYFEPLLSRAVGERGAVYAAEVEPSLVEHLRARAEKEGLHNLIPILASYDNPRLPPCAVDLVLIVDTFHHIDHRFRYFRALNETLSPGGRVVIVDFQKRALPVGPPLEHKIAREEVVSEMESSGYTLDEAPDFLPYQYVLIFRPSDDGDDAATGAH